MSYRVPTSFPGIKALRKKFPNEEVIRLSLCDAKGGIIVFEGRMPEEAKKDVAMLMAKLLKVPVP
jgi:hypothetical protein